MVTRHALGEIEIVTTDNWYIGYHKIDGVCEEITVQPPPKDADSFVDWMGMLNDVELEAAIQMVSDMWTFRDNSNFFRYSWDELLNERILRKDSPAASARSKALKKLLNEVERNNRCVRYHAYRTKKPW